MRYCPTCQKQFDGELTLCPEDGASLYVVPESAAERHVGTVLDGRWKLETVIGEGGMGAVYRAAQMRTGQVAAIKIIQARNYEQTELVSRFFREAQVLSSLQHPHIVKLLDFGQDEDSKLFFIAMELLQGQPLSAAAPDLTLAELVAVMEQLADALAQTHAQGIVHRDLKPENLFVNRLRGGGVHLTVLDFGIAKIDEGQMAKLTATGNIQGTPHYMAPEQIQGKGVSPQTDIYSLGCILYEMLAGREPFVGETPMAVLVQHLHGKIEPLTEVWNRPEPPLPELIAVTEQLMEREPENRPPDTLSVHAALRGIRLSLQSAQISGAMTRVPSMAPPPRPPAPASSAPLNRTGLGMIVAGFAAGVGVLGAAGWYVAGAGRGPVLPPESPQSVISADAGPAAPDLPAPEVPTEVVAVDVTPDAGGGDQQIDVGPEAPPPDVIDIATEAKVPEAGRKPRVRKKGGARPHKPRRGPGLGKVLEGMRKP